MASAYGETEAESVLTLCSEQCRVAPYQFEPSLNEPRTVTFDTDLTSSSDKDSSTSESSGLVSDIDCAQAGCESVIPPVEECLNESECDVILRNPHISNMTEDVLYHLSLSSGSHDLQQMFGDVKFVCMGGTPKRMESFANFIQKELNIKLPTGTVLDDISKRSYRYSMYKIGPVLSISHGMGIPSLSIMLHEVIKLMYHAKCKDVIFIRLGTCGGIGLPGGTLVVTESVVDGLLRPYLEMHVLGKTVKRPAVLDKELARELVTVGKEKLPDYDIVMGTTMCTYDFYEGQGRLDGAFCDYNEEDKLMHLEVLCKEGIKNIEMESLAFAAMCSYAKIKGAVVCVTLLNRLHGDQVSVPKSKLEEWQHRPQELAAAFIKKRLNIR